MEPFEAPEAFPLDPLRSPPLWLEGQENFEIFLPPFAKAIYIVVSSKGGIHKTLPLPSKASPNTTPSNTLRSS